MINLKIAAVIVAYNNETALKKLLDSLKAQSYPLQEVYIVNNGKALDRDAFDHSYPFNLIILPMERNIGSAGGYYEGLKTANGNNDYVWTLDNDNLLDADALRNLIRGIERLGNAKDLAAVRCVFNDSNIKAFSKMDTFAWRGTLIKSSVIRQVGLPLKEFFLYGEDVEYSMRIASRHYDMRFITNSIMHVQRDSQKTTRLLGKDISVYADIYRIYYATRNTVYIAIKYKRISNFLKVIRYTLAVIVILSVKKNDRKLKNIFAAAAGLFDGLRMKLGINSNYYPDNYISSSMEHNIK
jgi:GT2 family glycosyltransferase